MNLLLVCPSALVLVQFRADFIRFLISKGHRVCVIVPFETTELDETIRSLGAELRHLATSRTGTNPLNEFKAVLRLRRDIVDYSPEVILGYTHKGILYSGLGRMFTGRQRFYGMLSGLGVVFTGRGWKKSVAKLVFKLGYRVSTRGMNGVFFLNPDDAAEMTQGGFFSKKVPISIIEGEGVDLVRYPKSDIPAGPVSFLMIARLLRDKGVYEYLRAAKHLRGRFPEATVHLVGALDDNPASLTQSELDEVIATGDIVYHGSQRDVVPFLKRCSVYVLPSYREGLPRSTMEAMSVGRAVITTDVPGCRETVREGLNGFIVPAKDSEALAEAMCRLAENPELVTSMGEASYREACSRFEINLINRKLAGLMGLNVN